MYKYFKIIIDYIIAIILLPILILSIITVGFAIKLEDSGPVFYSSRRIGKNGRIFNMYKFRSMMINAPDIRLSDGSTFNSNNDKRITRVGHFIRRYSIDEIPQILNVLKGDMAIIGPRPDSAMWLLNYTDEERIILTILPGITGYNQVMNRNSVGTKEKLKNDIYYVKNTSFLLDVKVFLWTFKSLIFSKGIYRE